MEKYQVGLSEPFWLKLVLVCEGRHRDDLVLLPGLNEKAFGSAGGLHLDLSLLYLTEYALIAITFLLRWIVLIRD